MSRFALVVLLVTLASPLLAQPAEPAANAAAPAPGQADDDSDEQAAPTKTGPEAVGLTFTARIEPEKAVLGDLFEYVIETTHPEGVEVRVPNKPFVGDGFRFRGSRKKREGQGAQVVETITFELLAVRAGRQRIPRIEIPFIAGEQAGTFSLDSKRVYVGSQFTKENDPQLRSAGAPRAIVERNTPLIWTLSALGIALLSALLTILAVRILGPRLRAALPPPPPRPAHELAYERLEELRGADYAESGEFKAFYLDLSEIVREYFGNRYRILALGDTTTELMESLRDLEPENLDLNEVEVFLAESDLVKFAKFTPTRNDMEDALVTAQLLVDRTREEARERKEDDLPKRPAYEVASLTKRTFGFLADIAIFGIVGTLLAVVAESTGQPWLLWADLALAIAYLLGRDLPDRGSLGKMLAGLQIRDPQGEPVRSPGPRAGRNALLVIPLAGWVAEAVWMAMDPEKVRLGDRFAATRVLDTRPGQGALVPILGSAGCLGLIGFLGYVLPTYLVGG